MKTKTTQTCLFIFLLFSVIMPSSGASSEETIDKTYSIDSAQPVDFEFLDNDGDVFFSSWDREYGATAIRRSSDWSFVMLTVPCSQSCRSTSLESHQPC